MKFFGKIIVFIFALNLFFGAFVTQAYSQSDEPGPTTNITNELVGDEILGDNLGTYIGSAVNVLIVFGSLTTLIFLIWGGFDWLTSGGDQQKYESARNKITASIIGLAILASAWVIWTLLLNFFGLASVINAGGGTGGGSGSGSGYNCSPFSSCTAWQDAYEDEHGTRPSVPGPEWEIMRRVTDGTDGTPSDEDWLNDYCTNNDDPDVCDNR